MSRGLPSDFADSRRPRKPVTHPTTATVGQLMPVTEETRWDARRAVTKAAEKGAWTTAEARQAFDMLGLLPPPEPTGPLAVACPHCSAVVGAACHTTGPRNNGNLIHAARREAAA